MAGRDNVVGSSADTLAAAAPLAMGAVLATTLRATKDEDEIWRDLGDGALGTTSAMPFVAIIVVAVVIGLAVSRRSGAAHLRVVAAAGSTALVAGALVGVIHVVARVSGDDGQGELIVAGGLVLRVIAAALVGGLLAAPLAFRRIGPTSVLTSTAVLLAVFVLPWAAGFEDNSLHPTPSRLTLVFVLIPLLVSVVPATRLPGFRGGAFAVAVILLGIAMGALPWILDDAMACDDDDCVPLPLAGSWILVGALWLGSAAIGRSWDTRTEASR